MANDNNYYLNVFPADYKPLFVDALYNYYHDESLSDTDRKKLKSTVLWLMYCDQTSSTYSNFGAFAKWKREHIVGDLAHEMESSGVFQDSYFHVLTQSGIQSNGSAIPSIGKFDASKYPNDDKDTLANCFLYFIIEVRYRNAVIDCMRKKYEGFKGLVGSIDYLTENDNQEDAGRALYDKAIAEDAERTSADIYTQQEIIDQIDSYLSGFPVLVAKFLDSKKKPHTAPSYERLFYAEEVISFLKSVRDEIFIRSKHEFKSEETVKSYLERSWVRFLMAAECGLSYREIMTAKLKTYRDLFGDNRFSKVGRERWDSELPVGMIERPNGKGRLEHFIYKKYLVEQGLIGEEIDISRDLSWRRKRFCEILDSYNSKVIL